MKKIIVRAALLYMAVFPEQVYGQLPVADTTSKTVVTLGEVLIGVNKVAETRRTVAQQVQVLTAREMARLQAQNMADLMANTGNISVQKSQQGGGSPVIRGFEASRVLLVVDGVRMNNIIYRTGHLQNILTIDNTSLERVEILFGPSSTVYGSDALGGVIHVYTKKPLLTETGGKLLTKANAFFRYGSVNKERTAHIDLNLGGSRFGSFTSFTYSNFDDLRSGKRINPFYGKSFGERPFYVERFGNRDSLVRNDNKYLQRQSGYAQHDLVQKFLFQQSGGITHILNLQYSNSGDVPRYDRLTDPDGGGLRFAEWYYGPQKRGMAAYDLQINKPSAFFQQVHGGISLQDVEESRIQRRFNSNNRDSRVERVRIWGANFDMQRKEGAHVFRVGLDGQFNSLRSTAKRVHILTQAVSPIDTRYPGGNNSLHNSAMYFSHTWKLNESLTLNDGFRLGFASLHAEFTDTNFFKFPYKEVNQRNMVYSGSAGLVYSPREDYKLSMLLSTGFRVPNIDDLAKVFESVTGSLIVPNPGLQPERTINTELAFTKVFNEKARWEIVLYHTWLRDAIVTDRFTFNGQDSILYNGVRSRVLANQNKQRAYVLGFSTQLIAQLSERFNLTASAGYTAGRIRSDTGLVPLDHIPPFMSRLQMQYRRGAWSGDFFVQYNAWKRIRDFNPGGEDNQQYAPPEGMPAWFTANMRVSYKFKKYAALLVGVDNILDMQYRTFASGINAAGRNVFVTLSLRY
jgi:hemoglobin/transferrin/lactoferrin receptor protein